MLLPAAVDALLADAEASGTPIDGPDGLLAQITKSVLERALDVEIGDHLGYDHGDPAGHGSGNSRNGHGRKTVRPPSARSIWKSRGTATAPSPR